MESQEKTLDKEKEKVPNHVLATRSRVGHPRRCKAKFKKTPDRKCGNFALRGSEYCKFHGGRHAHKKKESVRKARLSRLPVIYRKHLNKTLHDAIEEQLGIKPSEQLMILEELALLRDFAGQSVRLYAGAQQSHPEDANKRQTAVMATGSMMAEILTKVGKMAEQAARIQSATSDQYSIHDIQYIVFQLVHIMHKVCGRENEHLALEFEQRVKEELVLPKQPEGTTVEPHHDVEQMDSMVPKVTYEESNSENANNGVDNEHN